MRPSIPRPSRRGDAAKVIIIVLASLFGLFVLMCAGVGVLGYFWWQKNFSRAVLSKPEDIRQLTAEMVDLTLPPEFQPYFGSAMFGMKNVSYRWCPTGDCPTAMAEPDTDGGDFSELETLTLSTFAVEGGGNDMADARDDLMSDESLKASYADFTQEVRELTIRGKSCKFYFVRGEPRAWDADDETEKPDVPAGEVKTTEAPAQRGTGKIHVNVQGTFPGKTGDVFLNFQSSAENYDEAKIMAVLQSIR